VRGGGGGEGGGGGKGKKGGKNGDQNNFSSQPDRFSGPLREEWEKPRVGKRCRFRG